MILSRVNKDGYNFIEGCKEEFMKRSLFFLIFNLLFFSSAVHAGDLNPPGPPGPTMKPLDEVGAWSQTLSPEQRFKAVLNGDGVLDRETGLVWEKNPGTSEYKWADAMGYCTTLLKGGRLGWRPPSIEELGSL